MKPRMTNGAAFTCYLVASLGCAGPSAALRATPATAISAQELYHPLRNLSHALQAAAYDEIGQLKFSELYERMLAHASSAAVTIDGTPYSGAVTKLLAARSTILSLDTQFANVATAWTISGMDPRVWSESAYATTLNQVLSGALTTARTTAAKSSLGLDEATDYSSTLYPVQGSGYCDGFQAALRTMAVNVDNIVPYANALRSECANIQGNDHNASFTQMLAQAPDKPRVSLVSKCNVPGNDATIVVQNNSWDQLPHTDGNTYRNYCATTNADGSADNNVPPGLQPADYQEDYGFVQRGSPGHPLPNPGDPGTQGAGVD